jgi:hypothetical protein
MALTSETVATRGLAIGAQLVLAVEPGITVHGQSGCIVIVAHGFAQDAAEVERGLADVNRALDAIPR